MLHIDFFPEIFLLTRFTDRTGALIAKGIIVLDLQIREGSGIFWPSSSIRSLVTQNNLQCNTWQIWCNHGHSLDVFAIAKTDLILSNLHKYKMAATENKIEIIILLTPPLIGLSKSVVHQIVVYIVVTMSSYVRWYQQLLIFKIDC